MGEVAIKPMMMLSLKLVLLWANAICDILDRTIFRERLKSPKYGGSGYKPVMIFVATADPPRYVRTYASVHPRIVH